MTILSIQLFQPWDNLFWALLSIRQALALKKTNFYEK
jgi:hypothetical protein